MNIEREMCHKKHLGERSHVYVSQDDTGREQEVMTGNVRRGGRATKGSGKRDVEQTHLVVFDSGVPRNTVLGAHRGMHRAIHVADDNRRRGLVLRSEVLPILLHRLAVPSPIPPNKKASNES